jgi:hypothetical protein
MSSQIDERVRRPEGKRNIRVSFLFDEGYISQRYYPSATHSWFILAGVLYIRLMPESKEQNGRNVAVFHEWQFVEETDDADPSTRTKDLSFE